MTLSISDFKANFSSGARPNLYRVIISELGEGVGFLAKAAQLPSSVIANIDVPYMGRQLKVAGNRTYEDWTITILNDIDFNIRRALEAWQDVINGHESNEGPTNLSYYRDGRIEQLDQAGNVIYAYELRDIWPTNIAAIELGYDTNDAIEEFQVTFAIGSMILSDGTQG